MQLSSWPGWPCGELRDPSGALLAVAMITMAAHQDR